MAKDHKKSESKTPAERVGAHEEAGHLTPRAVPDATSAATEENIAKASRQDPTPEQEHTINRIVEAGGLPRAIIQEQVLVKHPAPPEEKVVNAEDDPATPAAGANPLYPDLLPEPKRVVQGTPGTPGKLTD